MAQDEVGLVPIGRFSALSGVTVVTLRHYADIGVLVPAWIDPGSGYRYYRPAQVQQATTIRLLRLLGLGLDDIADLLTTDRDQTAQRLRDHVAVLEQRGRDQRRVTAFLIDRLTTKEPAMLVEITTRVEPAMTVLTRSRTVGIADLSQFLSGAFDELAAEAEQRALPVTTSAFTRYHGRVDEEHTSTVDACLPVQAEPGHPDVTLLPSVTVATAHVHGEDASYPTILRAYDAVAQWAGEHGHDLTEPSREIYRSLVADGGDHDHIEIAWPIS